MKPTPVPREWLTKLRESKDLTRPQLAEASGVTDTFIRNIENGTRSPRYPVAIRIGQALGLSEEESLLKFFSSK
jgi:transcriptional regulator with XRE-family HTH domain